jgi:predicted dehydrogenase
VRDSRLGVAVVGAGVHGSRYAEHLLRGDVPGARLAGVCRRTASESGRWISRGVRFETEAAALIDAPGVEAVVVASTPDLHEEHALAVLARGRPLLLEKPVAPDIASCARIRAAAGKARVPVLVGHSHRFNPVALRFREELRGLGALRSLSLAQAHPRAPLPWQFERPAGGALLCLGVHLADLVRWFLGEDIGEVTDGRYESGPFEAESSAVVSARTSSGIVVRIECDIAAPARRGDLAADGDGGRLEGSLVEHRLARAGRPLPLPPPVPGLVPLLGSFVAAVRGGSPGEAAALEDGIAAVEFVERCRGFAGQSPR